MPIANNDNSTNYVQVVKSHIINTVQNFVILVKKTSIINGEHDLRWTEIKVTHSDSIENSTYIITGKFSQGWTSLEELRSIIPLQYGSKSECEVEFFETDVY